MLWYVLARMGSVVDAFSSHVGSFVKTCADKDMSRHVSSSVFWAPGPETNQKLLRQGRVVGLRRHSPFRSIIEFSDVEAVTIVFARSDMPCAPLTSIVARQRGLQTSRKQTICKLTYIVCKFTAKLDGPYIHVIVRCPGWDGQ